MMLYFHCDKFAALSIVTFYVHLQVRYEPAAPVGDTAPPDGWKDGAAQAPVFPHLYGTIDFDAVTKEHGVERDAETGRFLSVEGVT